MARICGASGSTCTDASWLVPQEAFLFTGTIRDNIAYGCPQADDTVVEEPRVGWRP